MLRWKICNRNLDSARSRKKPHLSFFFVRQWAPGWKLLKTSAIYHKQYSKAKPKQTDQRYFEIYLCGDFLFLSRPLFLLFSLPDHVVISNQRWRAAENSSGSRPEQKTHSSGARSGCAVHEWSVIVISCLSRRVFEQGIKSIRRKAQKTAANVDSSHFAIFSLLSFSPQTSWSTLSINFVLAFSQIPCILPTFSVLRKCFVAFFSTSFPDIYLMLQKIMTDRRNERES